MGKFLQCWLMNNYTELTKSRKGNTAQEMCVLFGGNSDCIEDCWAELSTFKSNTSLQRDKKL